MPSDWTRTPTFFVSDGAVKQPIPELSGPENERWVQLSTTYPTLSILQSVRGVAVQSMAAAQRYKLLGSLVAQHPQWTLAKAMLAECHYLMTDSYGALELLLRCQELQSILKEEGSGEEDNVDYSELVVKKYRRPALFDSAASLTVDVGTSLARWRRFQESQKSVDAAIGQFARHAAISTNVLEGVFSIDGQSWPRLVKRGFYANSIEGIPRASKIKKKQKIVSILQNTEACFGDLTAVLRDRSLYAEKFVQVVHTKLLLDDNVEISEDDDGSYANLIPRGQYRRVPCFTTHESKGYETRFCPWKDVPREMAWYFEQARMILRDENVNPFLAAAWCQFAFLRIHPFADGNGRVARIISSIPLLLAGLPPVVVSPTRKSNYFDCLDEADRNGDCSALADFLKREMDLAFTEIEAMSAHDLTVNINGSAAATHADPDTPSTPSPLRDAMDAVNTMHLRENKGWSLQPVDISLKAPRSGTQCAPTAV
ncbi:hypothetical protein HDU86_001560 [Geranomyces michiganensis]|nr:hypothetical protein HDU86_001560 [Geranomyces michiganensis]